MHENLTSILLDLYLICKNNVAQKRGARAGQTKKQRSHAGNRCQSQDFYLHFTNFLHCLGKAGGPCSAKAGVFLVRDRFAPLVAGALAGHFKGHMGEPAVLGCAVPVLDLGRDDHRIAGGEGLRGLAPLLIPAAAGGAQQDLPAALGRMVDVPVVAAARLEGDVGDRDAVFTAEGLEVAVAYEILGVGVVGRPGRRCRRPAVPFPRRPRLPLPCGRRPMPWASRHRRRRG